MPQALYLTYLYKLCRKAACTFCSLLKQMQTSKEPLNCKVVYVELCFPFVKGKVLKVQPNLPATVPFRVGEKNLVSFTLLD